MCAIRQVRYMDSPRKRLNKQQTELRQLMMQSNRHQEAMRLFFIQHAQLHSRKMAQTESWSYEDEILDDMTEQRVRRIPHNCENSVAWCIWHIARIEDITMNLLVAGGPQVIHQGEWLVRMKITARDSGNDMSTKELGQLSQSIDLKALRSYRLAVGRQTRQIAASLQAQDLQRKVDPQRLQTVWDQGAVDIKASAIVDYWSKRSIAGLLLMPATRHMLVHLNEANRLKRSG